MQQLADQYATMDRVCVVAECIEDRVLPVTYELIAFARMLQSAEPLDIEVIVPGSNLEKAAHDLAAATGIRVTAIEGNHLATYNAETYKSALVPVMSAKKPRYVCFPHTARGCDLAPALAIRLNASCITAVEGLHRVNDALTFVRAIFKGKFAQEISTEVFPAVITVLPGSFPGDTSDAPCTSGFVEIIATEAAPRKTRSLGPITTGEADLNLAEADIIVSAGKGIGAEENLEIIHALAALFSKSAVGGSRIVCDLGWLGYQHQVGVTGKTVAPKLYIACGISGAIQHISGMRASQCVVAINRDPQAPIFQVADYCIVEDLTTFIPLFIETCKSGFVA